MDGVDLYQCRVSILEIDCSTRSVRSCFSVPYDSSNRRNANVFSGNQGLRLTAKTQQEALDHF